MTFDELQKTWQKDTSSSKLTIDPDLLLREVKRNKEHFESTIFWRDVQEVAAGTFAILGFLGFAVFFFYRGFTLVALGLVLVALFTLWVVLFFIADRIVQRKRHPSRGELLTACVEDSLTQVNHQIWLLKNVFWWYLLPLSIGAVVIFGAVCWQIHAIVGRSALMLQPFIRLYLSAALVFSLAFGGAYFLNRRAVRKDLMPRKVELESLLNNLTNDSRAT